MFRILLMVAAVAVVAQTDFQNEREYREEMREIDHAFAVLSENRHLQNAPEVESEATRLSKLFERVEDFWKARGDEEAANFARMAKDGAKRAGKAARESDEQSYKAAVRIIAASCEGCHQEPLDKYRFPLPK